MRTAVLEFLSHIIRAENSDSSDNQEYTVFQVRINPAAGRSLVNLSHE